MSYKFNKLQRAWIKALKSGKYNQGRGQLCIYSRKKKKVYYCCLGVACDVAKVPYKRIQHTITTSHRMYDGEIYVLPESMVKKLKLRSINGSVIGDKLVSTLTSLNDELRWNFKKIAEYIEKNPEKVFVR